MVQVIHLVRDPRAMFYSMSKTKDTWLDVIDNYGEHCSAMLDDLKLRQELPIGR